MIRYIVARLAQSVLVMLAVAFISFGLFRFVGDPINNIVGPDATFVEREQLQEDLGLNDHFLVQFARFAANAVRGEFGLSYVHKQPVKDLIGERFPATMELSIVSAALAILIGVPIGVFTAIKRHSVFSHIFMFLSLLGVSLPTFLIGILLILLFGVILRWLPTFGRGDVVAIGWWTTGFLTVSGWKALILPSITLAIFQIALIIRLVRTEMLEVLQTDFIQSARARGISNRSLYFRHALKNALRPVITIIGLQLGSIIAFSIVTESVFQWPGMGLLFLQSIENADIPVMSAYLFIVAFVFVFINLIVDLIYVAIDPRLRPDSEGGVGG
jgi:peptide/nickel transport system permease protein